MTTVLTLLLLNGVLGAIDTLWYHEWRARLPEQGGPIRLELALHAGRDAVYVVVYGTLGWVAWTGGSAAVLAALLAVEIVITLTDFVVEDRLRPAIGGMAAGERVLHSAMAIVYGAMLAHLVPIALRWSDGAGGLVTHGSDGPPTWMAIVATLFAIGIGLSGLRDALAVFGVGVFAVRAPGRGDPQTESAARALSPSSSSSAKPVSPAAAARRPKLTT